MNEGDSIWNKKWSHANHIFDSLGRISKEFIHVLDKYLNGSLEEIHLLPFFPSTEDRGFAQATITVVDPALENGKSIEKLVRNILWMFDFMINQIFLEPVIFTRILHNMHTNPI